MMGVETLVLSVHAQQGVFSGKPVSEISSRSTGTRTPPPPVRTGQMEGVGETTGAAGGAGGQRAHLGCRSVEGGPRVGCLPLLPASVDPDSSRPGSGNEVTSRNEEARGYHYWGCHEADRGAALGAALPSCGNCPALRGAD